MGYIVSLAKSTKKGVRKEPVKEARLIENHGIEGDAHSGSQTRQVSFLAAESIEDAQKKGAPVGFGDYAENIASYGIDWKNTKVGTRVRIGEDAIVEITQFGKKCHNKCAIYYTVGDCIMPREGVFGRVLQGGLIKKGDQIQIID